MADALLDCRTYSNVESNLFGDISSVDGPPLFARFNAVTRFTCAMLQPASSTVFAILNWAVIASLIETAKLNRVEPQAWLTDTLKRLANGHRINALGDLMPWVYAARVTD